MEAPRFIAFPFNPICRTSCPGRGRRPDDPRRSVDLRFPILLTLIALIQASRAVQSGIAEGATRRCDPV